MGKKSKIGRQRRDRFYHLAKETGYRSRAAFKLIQLNRKFEFLQKSRVAIDLCAAPGGWMQVAKQNMPVSSVVVGVDMYPMKPVPGCITLLEDITTDKCRVSLQKELKTWKADVILHDGAPNLGKNWLHDAYNQNCLTLSALKLATHFLREGGWFVSKVFRSKDYNCLLWVFKQLFRKVHATKPPASRNESAEIFVVCQYYLAPAKLDSRFFNPNYVFKELETEAPVTVQSLLKSVEKNKQKAEGYADDFSILHTKLPVSVFMASDTPAVILQNAYEIVLDDDEVRNHPKTTDEIKRCCEDIKVLGKKELRSLISWWKAFRDDKKTKEETEDKSEPVVPVNQELHDELSEEEKELDDVSKQIEEILEEEKREMKRKRKKVNKERMKLQLKMSLNMRQKDDLGPTDEGDEEIFQLSQITSEKDLAKLSNQKPDVLAESDDENEPIKKPKKLKYSVEDTYLDDSGQYYKSDSSKSDEEEEKELPSDVEGLGFDDEKSENEIKLKKIVKKVRFKEPEFQDLSGHTNEVDGANELENSHPLLTDLDFRDPRDKRLSKAQLWFDKDVFKDVETEADEDFELDKMVSDIKRKGAKLISDVSTQETKSNNKFENDNNYRNKKKKNNNSDENLVSISKENDKENVLSNTQTTKNTRKVTTDPDSINEWDIDDETIAMDKKRKKKERRSLDAEGLALGALMVNSKKAKRDIIDGGWNRYAFNDENLPEWFVEDEKKYMRKETPVPKELVDEYTKSREEPNVRTIKKVAEAKARKKKRSARRLEKLKKKLEGVMENPDMTEAEKSRQARQMYKKLKQPRAEVKYIVAKKHTAAKRARRPKGLKGPYKVVDPRMKKDLRGRISKETKNKSKKSTTKIKKSFKKTRTRK